MFGPHIRDLTVADGGRLIVCNTMNWDHNLYAVRVSDGDVRWRQRAGDYFAFEPQAIRGGFAVQGFDFEEAEGYHLYVGDLRGRLERRFALYGLPKRLPHRFVPGILRDRINSFAVPEDGSWVASAGDLGLAVWARDGRLLWSQDWWKSERHTARLAALGKDALLAVEGMKATVYQAASGKPLWSVELARAGEVTDIRVGAALRGRLKEGSAVGAPLRGRPKEGSHIGLPLQDDGRTIALLATTDGGRVFILREGKLVGALPTAANDACLSSDGSRVAIVKTNQLKLYSTAQPELRPPKMAQRELRPPKTAQPELRPPGARGGRRPCGGRWRRWRGERRACRGSRPEDRDGG
jgi:outer membrane protein assembly factor BamB